MAVSDEDIVSFLGKLINGKIPLKEADDFFNDAMQDFSDDAIEAVTHYIDDASIREKGLGKNDARYELWTRLDILDAYCSYLFGERFSIKQYAYCLACRLGCQYSEEVTMESISFCLKRKSGGASWGLEMEFFVGRVRVVVRDGPSQKRSDCRLPAIDELQLYDGAWTDLDYRQLRKVVLSGDADQMRRFAENSSESVKCNSARRPVLACPCRADTIDDASKHKKGDEVGDFLSRLINGEMTLGEASAMFEQMRDSLSDNAQKAVSYYIDNADIREKELSQDLWSRIFLLVEYVTYVSGEKFSLKQYAQCLACRLGCRLDILTARDSIAFCFKRRSVFSSWSLTMEFLPWRISVALRVDSWLFRSKRRRQQIYDGPWLELDFHELRRRVMSGEVDRTMDPMKYCRPYEGGW